MDNSVVYMTSFQNYPLENSVSYMIFCTEFSIIFIPSKRIYTDQNSI